MQSLTRSRMNVSYDLYGIEFEWDDQKSWTNLRKHKISFEAACEVFFDPFLQGIDGGIVEGEPRDAVVGMTESWRLLHVVYVEHDDIIRIVSARPAEKPERESYENQ